jgi:predicted exporter
MVAKTKLVYLHTLAALYGSVMELLAKLTAEVLAFIPSSEHAAHERPAETLAQRHDKQIQRLMDARQSIDLSVIVVNFPGRY